MTPVLALLLVHVHDVPSFARATGSLPLRELVSPRFTFVPSSSRRKIGGPVPSLPGLFHRLNCSGFSFILIGSNCDQGRLGGMSMTAEIAGTDSTGIAGACV